MDTTAFIKSLEAAHPPSGLDDYLLSLWYDGRNDWEKAHTLIQDLEDIKGSWIHAYLHRKEGDIWNADYWYRKAGKKRPDISLEEEWKKLAEAML